jgi:hypothetical protein
MELTVDGISIGVIATIGMDLWAAVAKHIFRLPTADWAMVGRWFGHIPRGIFMHRKISAAAPIPGELAIGWAGHYLTGVLYGLAYLFVVQVGLDRAPTLLSALIFGLVTLLAPWFVMQPAMGAGIFARRTPRPGMIRLVNLSMHSVFGVSLYIGWLLIQRLE